MGVRRAVEMVLSAPNRHKGPIHTYGPLIHNPQVLQLLEEKDIFALDKIPERGEGTVLIRAHGVPPQASEDLAKAGFNVIDATCPRVIKVQSIIKKHAAKGFETIIVGDQDHAEVVGLLGYAGKSGHVVNSLDQIKELALSLPETSQAIIVAQTTQNKLFFDKIRQWANAEKPHYKIFDTICDSTEKRQEEITRMAESVDAVVVVGGRNSGNTQRLAEIAGQTGKPSYHVESEEELDMDALRTSACIGITAGASTPKWIIRKICRQIEDVDLSRHQKWRRILFMIQRVLLLTNIYVSMGAGCLCYACCRLQGITDFLPYVLITIMYVQSMHMLNNLTGRKGDQYNDPDRAAFYDNHAFFLTLLAVICGAAGLLTAATKGLLPFLLLAAMSGLGLSYKLKLLPDGIFKGKCRRIKDIPGSKTILIAMAWGVVTSLFPRLSVSGMLTISSISVFIFATFMVFVRTAFFDILDIQGDRIRGRDTIPILIGEKKTLSLLRSVLGIVCMVLFLSVVFNLVPVWGSVLLLLPALMFSVLSIYAHRPILPGIRLEFLVETHFILAGLITIILHDF